MIIKVFCYLVANANANNKQIVFSLMTNIFILLVQRYKQFYRNGFCESVLMFVTVKQALIYREDLLLSNFTKSLNLHC